jgi:hypothetical protein
MPEFEAPPNRCDFCSNHETRWRYPCPDFSLDVPSLQGWNSDGDWAACDPCSTLIEAGQWDALVTRSQKHLNRLHPDGKLAPTQVKGSLAIIHQGFRQRRNGPRQALPIRERPTTEAGTYSRALDEREKLVRALSGPGVRDRLVSAVLDKAGPEAARELVLATLRSVDGAEVGFVSKTVCRILTETAPSIPLVTLEPEQLPAPNLFLALQDPLHLHEGPYDDLTMLQPLFAISWAEFSPTNDAPRGGIHLIGWAKQHGYYAPFSVNWPYGQTWGEAYTDQELGGSSVVREKVLRWLAALLAFCEQQLILPRRGAPERSARRRLERENKPVSDILVVELRRVQTRHDGHGEEPRQIAQDFSFLVSGHWRRQPYPSTQTVRAIWIKPTIKGNPSMPLRARKRVFAIIH